MAADEQENGTGSKDRKTVTLVAEMVAGVSEQVKSLDRMTEKEFKNTQRQLDDLKGLPGIVASLIEKVKWCQDEIRELKRNEVKRHEYRIGPMVANLVGFAGILVAIIAVVVASNG